MAGSKEVYNIGRGRIISEDDDENIISMGSSAKDGMTLSNNSNPLRSPARVGLDLSFAADTKDSYGNESSMSNGVQEQEILVIFNLPDGSQGENHFKLGQTVELLKSFVESEYGIPMDKQNLFIEDVLMMDPLSLLDFPETNGVNEVYILVDGPLPSESKK